jgi:hypothetical protein
MLQTGVALFVFSALEGFVIAALPMPRLVETPRAIE